MYLPFRRVKNSVNFFLQISSITKRGSIINVGVYEISFIYFNIFVL